MKNLMRKSFNHILDNKPAGSQPLIGSTWEQLYNWYKRTLPPGYSMDDIGEKLHQDHVIPLATLNSDNAHDAFKWYNLQLLPGMENITKSKKLSQEHINIQIMRLAVLILLNNII